MDTDLNVIEYKGLKIVVISPQRPVPASLAVGGVSLQFMNRLGIPIVFDVAYGDFLSTREGDITVDVVSDGYAPPSDAKTRAAAKGYWSISEYGDRLIFQIFRKASDAAYSTCVLDGKDGAARVYCDKNSYFDAGRGPMIAPFGYPMDFLVFSKLFIAGEAAILHGCALVFDGKAYVFSGKKGAGKSTMARLWLKRGATILNEEQVIVRVVGDEAWVFGSPWYGETRYCVNAGMPIEKIFFIEHGETNEMTELARAGGVKGLFSKLFIATAFKEEVPVLLATSERLMTGARAYRFAFVPDESAVDFVLERQ